LALAAINRQHLRQRRLAIPAPHRIRTWRRCAASCSGVEHHLRHADRGSRCGEEARRGTKGATATFASVYGGWQLVENNALAIAETANLLMIPGRMCENGRPVPLDREDFRKFAAGLADAGKAAYKAAQSKNLDAMVDVSGTVSDACAACHEVYRDKDDVKNRCIP
jgi:hypothetical protein